MQEPKHLYKRFLSPLSKQLREFKSRHPLVPIALELLNDLSGTSVAQWAEYRWRMTWRENTSRLRTFIKDVNPTPPGIGFSRPAWVKLNRLRVSVGLFRSETHKWGMASAVACECGTKE